ncbi:MAG: molybdopterin-dependent oxidoreductase, partial [Dehalococcoidia bacterium]|nr:molybdopterin-dependent oxidoreductase [Dehalococcoidia bacterium]
QVKPDTDVPLALSMMNVMIKEGLYDKDFVEKWTSGFDELAKHVEDYPPQKAAEITGVPAELIIKAARTYAKDKPGLMEDHVGVSHTYNGFAGHVALCLLRALTGNFDIKGGDAWLPSVPHFREFRNYSMWDNVTTPPVGAERFGLFLKVGEGNPPWGRAHGSLIPQAITEGKPYPIKASIIMGANPVVTLGPNRKAWEEALKKVEFSVVIDLFMTATAKFADIVLPAAWWPEKVDLSEGTPAVGYALLKQAAPPPGECWPESRMILALAKRLGMEKEFPWNTEEELIDEFFRPLTLEALKENPNGMWVPGCKQPDDITYKKYEQTGFNTPSGKIELYSHILENAGHDPLPMYYDYLEILSGETGMSPEEIKKKYPLILSKHN